METYSEMQKASRNFIRSCMKFTIEEFIKEVRDNDYVVLSEFMDEVEGLSVEQPEREDVIKVVGKNQIYEVEKEDYVEAFNRLTSIEKTIMHGYYYADATDQKISDALGLSRSTVWEIRHRALRKMKRYLDEKKAY